MLRCGLLGETLGHSYSPMIHHELGEYDYRLFEVSKEDLDAFLCSDRWDGLNVTIPYKKAVVPYCAELSEAAERLQSVNTLVRRPDGTLYGDNTDLFGFLYMVRRSSIDPAGKKALVLGSGGASVTVKAALEQLGADVTVTPTPRSSPTPPRWECIPITTRRQWIYDVFPAVKACWTSFITRHGPLCYYRQKSWGFPMQADFPCWWPRPSAPASSSPAR